MSKEFRKRSSPLWRCMISVVPFLGCEFDIQLDPGAPMTDPDLYGSSEDAEAGIAPSDDEVSRIDFVLAIKGFGDGPSLQYLMKNVLSLSFDGKHRTMWGWVQRISPEIGPPQAKCDWYVALLNKQWFSIELDLVTYPSSEETVKLALSLHGHVVDEEFLCGHVDGRVIGSSFPVLVKSTFAARKRSSSTESPHWVEIDCQSTKVPAIWGALNADPLPVEMNTLVFRSVTTK